MVEALAGKPGNPDEWPEAEEVLTTKVCQPVVLQAIDELSIDGLIVAGDGRPRSAPSVRWNRWTFRPDIAVMFRSRPLLAVEVKLLRGRGTGDAAAKGLGQAQLYRTKYEHTCLALYATDAETYNLDTSGSPWTILPRN